MSKVRKSRNNSVKLRRRSRNIKRKQRRTNKRIKRYSKRRMSKRRMTKRINQKKRSVKKQRGSGWINGEWQCEGKWKENGKIVRCGNYWKRDLRYGSRWCYERTTDGTDARVNNTNNSKDVDYMGQSLEESMICDNGPMNDFGEKKYQWKSGYCPECWYWSIDHWGTKQIRIPPKILNPEKEKREREREERERKDRQRRKKNIFQDIDDVFDP